MKQLQKISKAIFSSRWWSLGIPPQQQQRTVVLWLEGTATLPDAVPLPELWEAAALWVQLQAWVLVPPPPSSPLSNQSETRPPCWSESCLQVHSLELVSGHNALAFPGFWLRQNLTYLPWKSVTAVSMHRQRTLNRTRGLDFQTEGGKLFLSLLSGGVSSRWEADGNT